MKKILLAATLLPFAAGAQSPLIEQWILNENGKKASYWENANGSLTNPQFEFRTTNDSADVLEVCYTNDSVWVRSLGMTDSMGQYYNPGDCEAQNHLFRFPRNPQEASVKTESPLIGSIGLLLNGIPMYGLSNASSWNGTTNANNGQGIWYVEVYLAEGFVLDNSFGGHPQQEGAYHSHATPWRLFENTATSQHSPIVGYAFDGYPVYGPYGYSDPDDATSTVTRMRTGYSLRNITVRQSLPDGTNLSPTQYGPAVSSTYPIGTYVADYEWLSTNGDLDEYNGRFCKTPEYPDGIYAYFVTMDASQTPEFPYLVGPEYYGEPVAMNLLSGGQSSSNINIPSNASCTTTGIADRKSHESVAVFPNPASSEISIAVSKAGSYTLQAIDAAGRAVSLGSFSGSSQSISVSALESGAYTLVATGNQAVYTSRLLIVRQ